MGMALTGHAVTATDFIRHFKTHARSAEAGPIQILNHGQPAWTFVSADYFSFLVQNSLAHPVDHEEALLLDLVLDTIPISISFIDPQLRLTRINVAGRHNLGLSEAETRGRSVIDLLWRTEQQFIIEALRRVLNTGHGEVLEVDSPQKVVRTYRMHIEKIGDGIILLGEDITNETHLKRDGNPVDSYMSVLDGIPGLAHGRFNARGIISFASPNLASMIRTDRDRVIGMRLPALFGTASRTRVADALEELLDHEVAFTLEGSLQGGGGTDSIAVTISATCIHGRGGAFMLQMDQAQY